MSDFMEIGADDPIKSAWLDASDFGNGKRVVIVSQGRLLWIEDLQAWAWHDGLRWSVEAGAMESLRVAHKVIEHIDAEAMALAEIAENPIAIKERCGQFVTPEIAQKRVETLRGHAVRSGSAGMTAGMLKQARAFLSVRLDQFDVDPLVYNVRNQTLRFVEKDGKWAVEARPHDPLDMLMSVANVDYDPDAACPFWAERLEMLVPDAEQLAAFKPLYGYTLTGLTSDQSFYVHQGKGGDGKSMTHMALADLHGDYYRHAGIKTFLQGRDGGGAEHRSDLVRLRGDVRFVTADEPKRSSVWDGEIIKQITGSFVTARGANERTEVTFAPRFKFFAECNVIPRAPSDDKGFRRRFKLFMWQVSLDETPQGAMPPDVVLAKLKSEKSGILNWLIEGALEWLSTRTIPQPAAMKEVLADLWTASSPMLEWMEEWCDTSDRESREYFDALWNHFKDWAERQGTDISKITKTRFGTDLTNKQFAGKKDARGKRYRRGIKLRPHSIFDAGRGEGGSGDVSAPAGPLPPDGATYNQPAVNDGDDYVPGYDD
ncbi:MAG: DNA primase [Sphingobium sp.]|nr:DNA primase [Sphingobium sp.]